MRKPLFVLLLIMMSGCGIFTGEQSQLIQVTYESEVKGCQFLKSFTGPENFRQFDAPYLGNFKNEAMEESEKIGATHFLLTSEDTSLKSIVVLKAYRCPPGH